MQIDSLHMFLFFLFSFVCYAFWLYLRMERWFTSQLNQITDKFRIEMQLLAEQHESSMEKISSGYREVIDNHIYVRRQDVRTRETVMTKMYKSQRTNLSHGQRFKIMKRDGFKCQLCGKAKTDGAKLEVDHKMPVSKGGTNDHSNLWTLCQICNKGKSDSVVESIVNPIGG